MQCRSQSSVNNLITDSSVLLLSLLGDMSSDSVHVSSSLLGKNFTTGEGATSIRFELKSRNEEGCLELLKAVSNDFTGRESGVLGTSAVSLLG